MGIIHLEQAKELKEHGNRLGREGMSQRVIHAVAEFDGSYKGAMVLAGRLKAVAHMANADSYWSEKVMDGYQHEVNNIANFEPTKANPSDQPRPTE